MVAHLAAQIGVSADALESYAWTGRSGRRHCLAIMDHLADANGTVVARVLYYSDVTSKAVIVFARHVLPLEAVERLLSTARARLLPSQ